MQILFKYIYHNFISVFYFKSNMSMLKVKIMLLSLLLLVERKSQALLLLQQKIKEHLNDIIYS